MLDFKEFVTHSLLSGYDYCDINVANMYFAHPDMKITEIAEKTGKSVAELYQIIHRYGKPNRQRKNHHSVHMLSDSGLPTGRIAELTGYTERHVRNILKTERSNEY